MKSTHAPLIARRPALPWRAAWCALLALAAIGFAPRAHAQATTDSVDAALVGQVRELALVASQHFPTVTLAATPLSEVHQSSRQVAKFLVPFGVAAGIALGLAVIPVVFSISEDALTSVPRWQLSRTLRALSAALAWSARGWGRWRGSRAVSRSVPARRTRSVARAAAACASGIKIALYDMKLGCRPMVAGSDQPKIRLRCSITMPRPTSSRPNTKVA